MPLIFIACSNHYISYFKQKQNSSILILTTLNALKIVHRIMGDKHTRPAVKEFLEQMLVNSRWYEYAFVPLFRIIMSVLTLLVASACRIEKCQIENAS